MRFIFAGLLTLLALSGAAVAADGLPKWSLTPGYVRTDLMLAQICKITWGSDPRAVTESMKRGVFQSYGFSGNDDPRCDSTHPRRRCEVDHLVPRSIGGADDARNLWPEPYYKGTWTATIKDTLEAKAHRDVCNSKTSLIERQRLLGDYRQGFMANWQTLYLRYYPHP